MKTKLLSRSTKFILGLFFVSLAALLISSTLILFRQNSAPFLMTLFSLSVIGFGLASVFLFFKGVWVVIKGEYVRLKRLKKILLNENS